MISYFSPNDNKVWKDTSMAADNNFGGNRAYSSGNTQKSQDYTKVSGKASNIEENPVDTTTKDIDDLANFEARKREFSRRAETASCKDDNKEHFHESDPENRPLEDPTAVLVPDDKRHGPINKYAYGQGEYEGHYEGEMS